MKSDDDAVFDKEVRFEAADIEPMITYGTNPGFLISIVIYLPLSYIAGINYARLLKPLVSTNQRK